MDESVVLEPGAFFECAARQPFFLEREHVMRALGHRVLAHDDVDAVTAEGIGKVSGR
jgi:hypothetical protein